MEDTGFQKWQTQQESDTYVIFLSVFKLQFNYHKSTNFYNVPATLLQLSTYVLIIKWLLTTATQRK